MMISMCHALAHYRACAKASGLNNKVNFSIDASHLARQLYEMKFSSKMSPASLSCASHDIDVDNLSITEEVYTLHFSF